MKDHHIQPVAEGGRTAGFRGTDEVDKARNLHALKPVCGGVGGDGVGESVGD